VPVEEDNGDSDRPHLEGVIRRFLAQFERPLLGGAVRLRSNRTLSVGSVADYHTAALCIATSMQHSGSRGGESDSRQGFLFVVTPRDKSLNIGGFGSVELVQASLKMDQPILYQDDSVRHHLDTPQVMSHDH